MVELLLPHRTGNRHLHRPKKLRLAIAGLFGGSKTSEQMRILITNYYHQSPMITSYQLLSTIDIVIIDINFGTKEAASTKAITWIIRLVFCAFMVVAYLGYTPLLCLDYHAEEVREAQRRGIWKLKVG